MQISIHLTTSTHAVIFNFRWDTRNLVLSSTVCNHRVIRFAGWLSCCWFMNRWAPFSWLCTTSKQIYVSSQLISAPYPCLNRSVCKMCIRIEQNHLFHRSQANEYCIPSTMHNFPVIFLYAAENCCCKIIHFIIWLATSRYQKAKNHYIFYVV